jgi:hypothetical protein
MKRNCWLSGMIAMVAMVVTIGSVSLLPDDRFKVKSCARVWQGGKCLRFILKGCQG